MTTGQRSNDAAGDGRNETQSERSDRNWTDILQELRVTQTGTQIISGFLLAVAFQQRFPMLRGYEITIYAVLVCLAALSTVSGLTVVSIHRAQFRRHDKPEIVAAANRILEAGTLVVAILTAGVVMFIFDFVLGLVAGILVGVVALILLVLLLIVLPKSIHRYVSAP